MAIYFTSLAGAAGCFSDPAAGGNGSSSSSSSAGGASTTAASGTASTSGGTGSASASTSSTSASAPTVDCSDLSTATGTVDTRYGSAEILAGSNKSYFLQSNWWHTYASETEDYSGVSFTVHNPMAASVPSTDGNPMGFPSIFIGQYGGNTTVGSNLPKLVSSLTSVPTVYQTNNSTIGLSGHNATYDVWLTAGSAPLDSTQVSPGMGGAYLMVWMFKPTDRQPRGSNKHPSQTVNGVSGTWDVWIDSSTNPPCISYVSHTPIDGLAFDLNDFIQDSVTKQYGVTSTMYLSLVFGGFEIWGGADGLQLQKFCATVQ